MIISRGGRHRSRGFSRRPLRTELAAVDYRSCEQWPALNDSAVKVLGDETLRAIAREPVAAVRANVTIDWAVRVNVRAHRRLLVNHILRRHGYPPDRQEKVTQMARQRAPPDRRPRSAPITPRHPPPPRCPASGAPCRPAWRPAGRHRPGR
ncbi:type I restriction enzyme endonuclease domain-containing protein [Caldinitratiruptor microaerophilus]|uniref:type I restriction enzyme endonuclease domain-containing protein n=1 Tax=Caldinitratiruptor microaerophilus TaxID=671077 RepID=UPI003872EBF9